MRSRVAVLLAALALAAVAACLNPQPLPPEDENPRASGSSGGSSSGGFGSSSGDKVDDGEIVPPAPHTEGGVQDPDAGDGASDAGTDGPTDASDAG
jgi:hypothetical protein